MGQFKHIMRRNVRVVYIIENNGVYGLTKGQFSATAETGLRLTHSVDDPLPVTDYLKVMGKYRHLAPDQIEHIERHIAENVRVIKQQIPGAGAPAG